MLMSALTELGPWNWMLLGVVLLILEVLVPGVFLLWIGIAALLTGLLSLQLWDWSLWTWHVQVLLFLVLSIASVLVGRRILKKTEKDTDEPLLNRRSDQMIGRIATLIEASDNGYGRIRIDDTVWRVRSPDLPAGARVKVTSAQGTELTVAAD